MVQYGMMTTIKMRHRLNGQWVHMVCLDCLHEVDKHEDHNLLTCPCRLCGGPLVIIAVGDSLYEMESVSVQTIYKDGEKIETHT